jgi:hypothetical protein
MRQVSSVFCLFARLLFVFSLRQSYRELHDAGDIVEVAEQLISGGGSPGYSIDAGSGRKDLRAEFYGGDPYASLKNPVPTVVDTSGYTSGG